MTRVVDDPLTRTRLCGTDAVGRLQLVGVFLYCTAAVAFASVRFVLVVRGGRSAGVTEWLIALGIGAVLGLAAVIGQIVVWRRRGGQHLVRLGRRVWRTGELPEVLPARIAVLRDLERRDRELDRQVPLIALGVFWTVYFVLQVISHHAVLDVIGLGLLWGAYVAITARNVLDRRRWPRLRQLVAELRENPVPASREPAQ